MKANQAAFEVGQPAERMAQGYYAYITVITVSDRRHTATPRLSPGRWFHTATLLPNGQVLVAVGSSRFGPLARAQLYKSAPEMLDIQ